MVPRTRGTIDTGFIIRKDWVEKLGMDMPTTIEDLADFAIAVGTGDVDGNGKIDSIGMLPSTGWFDDAFGCRDPVFTDDGQLIHVNFTDAYADMLQYFRDIYAQGGIAQEFALIGGQQAEEMFMNGTLGSFNKNVWHTFRMQEEARKVHPDAETYCITHLKGPKGYANNRDLGFAGGNMFPTQKTDEAKLLKILDFMNRTADPKYFNFLVYGVEGVHWNYEEGEPKATEKGLLEATNSNAYPFTYSMDEFAKVNSPLATAAYNREMREHVSKLYEIDRKVPPFAVSISDTWNVEWPKISEEFNAMYVKAISGTVTMDEFRQYQKVTREMPGFQQAFREFAESYKDFFK
jgi:putative aldouronate transport system substrate-binding protein